MLMNGFQCGTRCAVALSLVTLFLGLAVEAEAQEEGAPESGARSLGANALELVGKPEQEPQEEGHEASEEELKRHKIIFLYGTSWVPQGDPSAERTGVMVVPTLGIDYEFWFTHKVAVGVLNDFELSQYVVETHDGEEIEREYVYILVLAFIYEPIPNLSLFVGPGREFEKNHDFFVFRIGAEYGIPIRNHWDVGFSVSYDYKDAYDGIGFGISFGKRF